MLVRGMALQAGACAQTTGVGVGVREIRYPGEGYRMCWVGRWAEQEWVGDLGCARGARGVPRSVQTARTLPDDLQQGLDSTWGRERGFVGDDGARVGRWIWDGAGVGRLGWVEVRSSRDKRAWIKSRQAWDEERGRQESLEFPATSLNGQQQGGVSKQSRCCVEECGEARPRRAWGHDAVQDDGSVTTGRR